MFMQAMGIQSVGHTTYYMKMGGRFGGKEGVH